jgi:hypothetical protein
MLIQSSAKTSWFRIYLVLFITLGAVYVVRESLAEPFVQWQTLNEIRVAEIEAMME